MGHNPLHLSIRQAMALTAIVKTTPEASPDIDALLDVAYSAEWAAMEIPSADPRELAYKMCVFANWIGDLKNEDFEGFDGFAEAASAIAADLLRIVAKREE